MTAGAWQVRVDGNRRPRRRHARGAGADVAAVDARDERAALRALLVGLMLMLAGGFVAIVAAMAREASARAGESLDTTGPTRAGGSPAPSPPSSSVAVVVARELLVVGRGGTYERYVYKPLERDADVAPRWRGSSLDLQRSRLDRQPPPRRLRARSRSPDAPVRRLAGTRSAVASASGRSRDRPRSSSGCPTCRPAQYELFADLVHATGVSETVTGRRLERDHGARAFRVTTAAPATTARWTR